MNKRTAFMFADVLMALAVIAVIGGVLLMTLGRHHRAMRSLADGRRAAELAEQALLELRTSGKTQVKAEVRRLPSEGLQGQMWIEVRTSVGGRSATLVGLVPASAAPGEEKP